MFLFPVLSDSQCFFFESKKAAPGFEMRREEPFGHELQRSHVVTNLKGNLQLAIDAQEFGPEGGASSTASGCFFRKNGDSQMKVKLNGRRYKGMMVFLGEVVLL